MAGGVIWGDGVGVVLVLGGVVKGAGHRKLEEELKDFKSVKIKHL
jgi:hypothetical protein